MSGEVCTDNRFEIIEAYKKKLIERTNIETSPAEMDEIDNILFRLWQMGWLPQIPHGRLIDADELTERLDGIWDCNDIVFDDDNICERIHADCNSCRWRETRDYIADHVIKHAPTIIPAEEGEA